MGASAGLGNAPARLEAFVISTGTYAYGGYPDIDDLFRQQAQERDRKKREAMLHQLQRLMHERVMHAPIFEPATLHGVGPRVEEPAVGLNPLLYFAAPYRGHAPQEAVSTAVAADDTLPARGRASRARGARHRDRLSSMMPRIPRTGPTGGECGPSRAPSSAAGSCSTPTTQGRRRIRRLLPGIGGDDEDRDRQQERTTTAARNRGKFCWCGRAAPRTASTAAVPSRLVQRSSRRRSDLQHAAQGVEDPARPRRRARRRRPGSSAPRRALRRRSAPRGRAPWRDDAAIPAAPRQGRRRRGRPGRTPAGCPATSPSSAAPAGTRT